MSWSLFYEEPSSWTTAVAEVCSAVVSYGVEIPWCVCQQSWTVLSFLSEYAALLWAFVYVTLRLEEWWCFELTVFSLCFAMNVPLWIKRSGGNWYILHSHIAIFLAGMAWMGCFLETAAGLQGGVVFGGKLFYPSLALMALAVQACRYMLLNLEKEVYGYGHVEAETKDNKVCKTIAAFAAIMRCESVFFFALAAFGLPKFEQDTDIVPW